MPLNRLATVRYAQDHWNSPCDDGYFCSYTAAGGRVVIREAHARLRRQGKLPDPDNWRAVFLPADSGSERACFIRPNPNGTLIFKEKKPAGDLMDWPENPPADLTGRFDMVPFHEDHGLVDCAHFVSRCLSTGGIKINHAGVPELVRALRNLPYTITRTLGYKATRERGEQILNTGIVKPGDLIAYWKPIEREHRTDHGHSAIYVGVETKTEEEPQSILNQGPRKGIHRIACHTVSRFGISFFDDPWYLSAGPERLFTIIHFVDPDDAIAPASAALLKSWIAVGHTGRTEFYHFLPDGTCEKAGQAPKSGKPPHVQANDHGYWFERRTDVFVFWPMLGQVDQFSLADLAFGGDDSMSGTVNEHTAIGKRLKD
jgi:hypothetical protein